MEILEKHPHLERADGQMGEEDSPSYLLKAAVHHCTARVFPRSSPRQGGWKNLYQERSQSPLK